MKRFLVLLLCLPLFWPLWNEGNHAVEEVVAAVRARPPASPAELKKQRDAAHETSAALAPLLPIVLNASPEEPPADMPKVDRDLADKLHEHALAVQQGRSAVDSFRKKTPDRLTGDFKKLWENLEGPEKKLQRLLTAIDKEAPGGPQPRGLQSQLKDCQKAWAPLANDAHCGRRAREVQKLLSSVDRILELMAAKGKEDFDDLDGLATDPPELRALAQRVALGWVKRYWSPLPYDKRFEYRGDNGWAPFETQDTYVTVAGTEYKLWMDPAKQFKRCRLVRMDLGTVEETEYDKSIRPTQMSLVAHACNTVFETPPTPARVHNLPDELWKQYQSLAARYDDHRKRIEGQKPAFVFEELSRFSDYADRARKLQTLIETAVRCKNLFPPAADAE